VVDKLLDRGQVGQRRGVIGEVVEGDQRVRLAAAVRQLELAHCLVVLSRQPKHHVPRQFAQVVGGIGEGKELARVFVDAALAPPQRDVIQVGGEGGQRKLT